MSEIAERQGHVSRALRRPAILAGLSVLLGATFLFSLATGAVPIGGGDVLRSLFGLDVDGQTAAVIQMIRLPRALLALVVGAALAGSGAAFQGLFRNPLADPSLIGVSSGAAFGAVVVIVFGGLIATAVPFLASPFLLPFFAFAGGIGATFAIQGLAQSRGQAATATLLLAGIAINALTWALTGFTIYMANDAQIRDFTFWSMGSLASGGWKAFWLSAVPVTLALGIILSRARALDAMLLGEREALHLGIPVHRLKHIVMIAAALAVSSSVAVSGVIGFVGIVVPHVVRMLAGPDHRIVLPGSILAGAALLLAADSFARIVVAPAELPIGLVTAAIGSPFFLWLLTHRKRSL
ncbi:iron ABC transporter permease [Parvibaculum sp.]|jgi:iron complex transport system permease protein|uniref:FecCD family ABC transporter permease n=1 Tax=Parvibaculum sp. TaxID=2024848 RepID=UPI000C59CCFA|nr:iron ABC transporter permease [Parvibaculum sp.]MAM95181.1 heme ABC transporter permease [Parvibaculum sp.]HCX68922.1 heme ABC transporter permease [Rhodobiaceae bacterium]|tara:strand:+ start:11322 stop:12377 length:1056 start_codon:yes stop_codon:yes gene_type:complete